ncbi:MAG TPA: hypothetical protein VMZ25_09545 [Terriglobales bacterium]|nr:hypothetical protein [Terriglobales bacterium]
MPNSAVHILAVDHSKETVLVEFSNGQTGSFDSQFLFDNIQTNGNADVTELPSED